MLLTQIPPLATSAMLTGLIVSDLSDGLYTISVSSSEDTILKFKTAPYKGIIRIDDISAVIDQYARASRIIAPSVTITLTDSDNISQVSKTFCFIPTPADITEIPAFLRPSPAAIIPPGAQFTFATCSGETPQIQFHTKDSAHPQTLTHTTAHSGAAHIHTITAPGTQGIINISIQKQTLTLFVTHITSCHTFTYTNAYNAPQHTYAQASVRTRTTRKTATAIIGGSRREYDIETNNEFEIEITTDSSVTAEEIAALAWARDISIDGHPVIITDLEAEHRNTSNSAITTRFTAALARPTIFFTGQDPARIFTPQFTVQYT